MSLKKLIFFLLKLMRRFNLTETKIVMFDNFMKLEVTIYGFKSLNHLVSNDNSARHNF